MSAWVVVKSDRTFCNVYELSDEAIAWLVQNEPGFKHSLKEATAALEKNVNEKQPPYDGTPSAPRYKNKSGKIYVAKKGRSTYKIGLTRGRVKDRIKAIQNGMIEPVRLVASFDVDRCDDVEAALHEMFKDYRVKGEWFKIPKFEVAEVEAAIREIVSNFQQPTKEGFK